MHNDNSDSYSEAIEKIGEATCKLEGIAGLLSVEEAGGQITLNEKTVNGVSLILTGIADTINVCLFDIDKQMQEAKKAMRPKMRGADHEKKF